MNRVARNFACVAVILLSVSDAGASWVKRPEHFSPLTPTEQSRLAVLREQLKEQIANLAANVKAREGQPSEKPSEWNFSTSEAATLRASLLQGCFLVLTDSYSSWTWAGWLPERPVADWHVLGTAEGCKQAPPKWAKDHELVESAVEEDIRRIATTLRADRSVLLSSKGERLTQAQYETLRQDAGSYVLEQARSRDFRVFGPVHDEYTSKAFFGQKNLQFLREIRLSGWADRMAATAEVVADRFGPGRLALSAAFTGPSLLSSEPALATENDPQKDNLQKLFDNGGDFALSYELPLLYAEKRSDTPGFVIVELFPRIVGALPALGSKVEDASLALQPGVRAYMQLKGYDDALGLYADVWSGWVFGVGPNYEQYVDRKDFFITTVSAGVRIMDRFNVGASYLLAGPLAGRNGVTITVTANTGLAD